MNKKDELFYGRRVLVLHEDDSLQKGPRASHLMNLVQPHAFDNLVLVARRSLSEEAAPPALAVFSPRFLHAIREGANCRIHSTRPDFFSSSSSLTVAMHVRRGTIRLFLWKYLFLHVSLSRPTLLGDVDRNNRHFKADAYFLNVAKLIREIVPNASIHAFSSTEKKCMGSRTSNLEDCEAHGKKLYEASSFNAFALAGIPVHLDGDSRAAWSHFVRADVFVMSPSAFSAPPSYLNPKCVLWLKSIWTTLRFPHWITSGDLEGTGGRCALEKCLLGTGGKASYANQSCVRTATPRETSAGIFIPKKIMPEGIHPHSKNGAKPKALLLASKHTHKPGRRP
jgi:hypothetical protein